MPKPRTDVLVIGGGAAGQMAAIAAAQAGAATVVLEKMPQLGLKMGLTGKGRCNLTHHGAMEEFIRNTPGNGKFLYGVYRRFTNEDLLAQVHAWGVATKVERGGRVFPVSDSAQQVRRVFREEMERLGVWVRTGLPVTALRRTADGFCVQTAEREFQARTVVLTAGGASYPQTGSDGSGFRLAKSLGHRIVPPRPALVPLLCEEPVCKELQGLSLRNVELTLLCGGKAVETLRGEMLFTHFGVSGPLVLRHSDRASAALAAGEGVRLLLNLKPALRPEQLDARLQREIQEHPAKTLQNLLLALLPQRLAGPVLAQSGVAADVRGADLPKAARQQLVAALQAFPLTVTGTRPLREAIVTAGGVDVREVRPNTLGSKLVPGLYFGGEVLDIHAYTGGYNLQAAFSTGFVAGSEAAAESIHG